MKEYKIVAYGPNKKCLTWADDTDLGIVKDRLKRKGYSDIRVEEE